jgi:UDP-N-acetylmuramyl tripeptide synthase
MTLLAIWLGKVVHLGLRAAGRTGSALPGLIVERLFPRFLPRVLARLPQGVVVVSGTNGKTTTTKMVATILARRYRVLTNHTGSNLLRGVVGACVVGASWRGKLPYDVAVFELDELWAVRFAAIAPPQRVLLLNVMRDQLDRFGDIGTIDRALKRVAAAATAHAVLNRDDPRIAAAAHTATAPVTWYGVAADLRPRFPADDDGDVAMPAVTASVTASVELVGLPTGDQPGTILRIGAETRTVRLQAVGPHNAQNAAGAGALALTFGFTPDEIAAGLAEAEPAFGRGQWFDIDGRRVLLGLVKNAAGFRQSLHILDEMPAPDAILIVTNDAGADGRDVSWLADVDFTALGPVAGHGVRTSGTRAADVVQRLTACAVPVADINPDARGALASSVGAVPAGGAVVVFASYTAMWELYSILSKWAAQ